MAQAKRTMNNNFDDFAFTSKGSDVITIKHSSKNILSHGLLYKVFESNFWCTKKFRQIDGKLRALTFFPREFWGALKMHTFFPRDEF